MANPFDQFDAGGNVFDQFDAPTIGSDVLKSIPKYAESAAVSVLGLPGDIVKGGRWLGEQVGLGDSSNNARIMGSTEVREDLRKTYGDLYEPQTKVGKGIDLAAAIAPAAIGGPGSIAARVGTRVAAPAAVSTAAGAATEGTELQPLAEFVGLLATPFAANKTIRAVGEWSQRGRVPTTPMIKGARDSLYKLADMSGTQVKQSSYLPFMAQLTRDLQHQNQDMRKANPAVAGIVSLMADALNQRKPVTLRQMQIWRKMAGKIMDKHDSDIMGQGALLWSKINGYMRGLTANELSGRNAQYSIDALKQADTLHGRYKNSQMMDKFYAQAKNRLANYSQAGEATGLKQKFRALADKFADENTKEFRFFSAEQRKAIEEVARGSVTERTLRAIGSFVPWGLKGAATIGSPTITAALLGFDGLMSSLTAGIPSAIATGAKVGSHMMTKRAANKAADLVRLGQPLPPVTTPGYGPLSVPLSLEQLLQQQRTQ